MSSLAESLIQTHGRLTPARLQVLEILLAAPHALSHAEIEARLAAPLDRVTLYRVLDWLVAKGLGHKIPGEDRSWRFNAIAHEAHGHAHFHCTRCGQVFCLSDLQPAFALSLPPGYRFQKAELSVHGECPACAQTS